MVYGVGEVAYFRFFQQQRLTLILAPFRFLFSFLFPPFGELNSVTISPEGGRNCDMDTCSGSCIQSGEMDFICLIYDYFALLDLIS